MTKNDLLNELLNIAQTLTHAADTITDVGAFLEFTDDQEGQFWQAYDTVRFEVTAIHALAQQIRENV